MATLFNQTNLNSGTSFASSGNVGSNPTFTTVSVTPWNTSYTVLSDTLQGGFYPYAPGLNVLGCFNKANGQLGPFQAGGYVEVQMDGNGPSDALWRMQMNSEGMRWISQAPTPGGTPITLNFLTINKAVPSVNLVSVSTITAGTDTANMISLLSSLKSAYPSNFS